MSTKLTRDQLFALAQEHGDPATGRVFGKKTEGYVHDGKFLFDLNGEIVVWPQDDARPLEVRRW